MFKIRNVARVVLYLEILPCKSRLSTELFRRGKERLTDTASLEVNMSPVAPDESSGAIVSVVSLGTSRL